MRTLLFLLWLARWSPVDTHEHSPDCACPCCWEDRMAEMVAAFDWSAAELDFGRRP